MSAKVKIEAALHELRCRECRVTWLSWVQRLLGMKRGYEPTPKSEWIAW